MRPESLIMLMKEFVTGTCGHSVEYLRGVNHAELVGINGGWRRALRGGREARGLEGPPASSTTNHFRADTLFLDVSAWGWRWFYMQAREARGQWAECWWPLGGSEGLRWPCVLPCTRFLAAGLRDAMGGVGSKDSAQERGEGPTRGWATSME